MVCRNCNREIKVPLIKTRKYRDNLEKYHESGVCDENCRDGVYYGRISKITLELTRIASEAVKKYEARREDLELFW